MNREAFQKLLGKPIVELATRSTTTKQSWREALLPSNIPPVVLVISTGRSGTMTLAAILNLSDGLDAHHEPYPKTLGLSRLAFSQHDREGGEWLARSFVESRRALLARAWLKSRAYGETSPQVSGVAIEVARTYKSTRIIHLVRSPGAFLESARRRKWYGGHQDDHFRLRPRAGTSAGARWSSWDAAKRSAWYWVEINRLGLLAAEELGEGRCISLRSEDLFSGNRDELDRVFDFLGVASPAEGNVLRVLRRHLNSSTVGERADQSVDVPKTAFGDVHESLQDVLMRFDYSLD